MTALVAAPMPILRFCDNAGNPAVGGSVLTQVGGVNYPTYQDANGDTALPNPIPLNSRGEISTAAGASAQLFLDPAVAYTFTLSDAAGNQIWQAMYVSAAQILSGSGIFAAATEVPANSFVTQTVQIEGAQPGQAVAIGMNSSWPYEVVPIAYVSAASTVTYGWQNASAYKVLLAETIFQLRVIP